MITENPDNFVPNRVIFLYLKKIESIQTDNIINLHTLLLKGSQYSVQLFGQNIFFLKQI